MTPQHQQHLSEDDLILHYYGESASPDAAPHLAACARCREQYQSLQRVLNIVDLPVPERAADYEDQVWNRLAPKLGGKTPARRFWFQPRAWAATAAMASLLAVAFLAGRFSPDPTTAPRDAAATTASSNRPVRERILVVAANQHLERSEMILIELVKSPDAKTVDITDEQSTAEDLLFSNRLLRQTATTAGDSGLVTLLDDLERVLVDVVHSPGSLSQPELDHIRERIESQGLIFKMRVMGTRLNERVATPAATPNSQQPESKEL